MTWYIGQVTRTRNCDWSINLLVNQRLHWDNKMTLIATKSKIVYINHIILGLQCNIHFLFSVFVQIQQHCICFIKAWILSFLIILSPSLKSRWIASSVKRISRAHLLYEKSKRPAISVPKQMLCASNIESIQT